MTERRAPYNHLIRILFCVVLCVFLAWTSDSYAKIKIPKLDYGVSWKKYIEKDFNRKPGQIFPYESCFEKAATEFELPMTLLLAMARGESDFDSKAKSSKSCYGIMQLQWPGTAKDMGIKSIQELYDPCKNIRAGAKYIRKMIDRYNGDVHLALAAYNFGPGRIGKHATAASLPQNAVWYSGYVYHHLQQVLVGSIPEVIVDDIGADVVAVVEVPVPVKRKIYKPGKKLPVILFHNPTKAMGFLAYFKAKSPALRLDWFRTSLGETYIVLLYDTDEEKRKSVATLNKLGYHINENNSF